MLDRGNKMELFFLTLAVGVISPLVVRHFFYPPEDRHLEGYVGVALTGIFLVLCGWCIVGVFSWLFR
jgi:hypothetical protein